jgi:hypothetical protein
MNQCKVMTFSKVGIHNSELMFGVELESFLLPLVLRDLFTAAEMACGILYGVYQRVVMSELISSSGTEMAE